MKLLNFSIGSIDTVQIGNEPVKTGHLKSPVNEPWIITEDGAEGDRRAIHPDKLYAFARDGYNHWGSYLRVDPSRWPDGFFGENLTLDSLDEEDVRVGDVFEIGDEVKLVVAGSRTPCVKLAWRLNQPRTFQKIFARSRRTGVYFGVLSTGRVAPMDRLVRTIHDSTMPSIADVCDYVAGHTIPPLEPLKRLLAFEHLSLTIRLLLASKLDAAERAAAASEGRWAGWRPFEIERVVDEAPDIRSFHLRPTDDGPLCRPKPGQFVTVQIDAPGGAVSRSWSISHFAHEMNRYRITVRRQSGPGSTWIHAAESGAQIMLRAPTGQFVLDEGGFRPVLLIAAGVGITPLLSMLQAHLLRPIAAPVYLVYGARTPHSMAFYDELQALAAEHPSLHIFHVYSQSDAAGRPAGRLTIDLLMELLADFHVLLEDGSRVPLPWFESDAYLCGPGAFCEDLRSGMIERGANPDRVFFERFTSAQAEKAGVERSVIRFRRSGRTAVWDASEDLSLLDLAEQSGVVVQSDCRVGSCLTCKAGLLAGETTAQGDASWTLLCIARPKSEAVELDV